MHMCLFEYCVHLHLFQGIKAKLDVFSMPGPQPEQPQRRKQGPVGHSGAARAHHHDKGQELEPARSKMLNYHELPAVIIV